MFWLRNKKIKFSIHTLNSSPVYLFMILQRELIWDLTKVDRASCQLTIGLWFIYQTAMHLLSTYHHNIRTLVKKA